jgi:hypothetical protein
MVNAWSLAASILNGTFDEDYPIVNKKETEHSDYYYDYTRNDSNAKNPFTDPKDRERAEKVVNDDLDLDRIERMGGFEWTPGSPWPPVDPLEDCNGLDYETDLMTDQYAHHYTTYDDGMSLQVREEQMSAHYFKYHEKEILKDIEEYVSGTYQGHYTGNSHEFRKVQTIDLMASKDLASSFCQANILKYGSRYGNKDGKNKKDLLKVIHYAMLLLHFDGHYGEPSMPSGNFDQMP